MLRSLLNFSVNSAIDTWWKDCSTTRRPNQSKQKDYRPRASTSDTTQTDDAGEGTGTSILLDDWDDWFDIPV